MNYLKLMRPKHYIKNILIFLPLMFSGMFFEQNNFLLTFVGFIAFCWLASVIYIINDIKDVEKDRKHPTKKERPIAAGKISERNAIIFAIVLIGLILLITLLGKFSLLSIILMLCYLALNIAYSLGLKNIPLLDVVILVSGFLLRVIYGASLLGIEVSSWLYLTVIVSSFYLGLGKRRNEIIKNGNKSRNVLQFYTKEFLDKSMSMFLTMAIIFYSLWTTEKSNNLLVWTVPFVILICLKYNLNIDGDSDGDPVEVILKDKVLLILGVLLALALFIILYII